MLPCLLPCPCLFYYPLPPTCSTTHCLLLCLLLRLLCASCLLICLL